MPKGVVKHWDGANWLNSIVRDTGNDTAVWDDGLIKHWDKVANAWQFNYPMEQEYTQSFSCTWTQSYEKTTKVWAPTYGDHLYSGGAANFRSYVGFSKTAISNFVTPTGKIQAVSIHINLKETSPNGTPTVHFYPHDLSAAPASWSDLNINKNYDILHGFPNKAYGGYTKNLTANHIRNPNNLAFFAGLAIMPQTITEEDWAVFNGKGTYDTQLKITVIK